ncbi:unnamed protein product [Rotaria socialis]
MFKHFLCQLFSSQCQLNSLRLDIGSYDIDQCIKIFSDSYYNPIPNQVQSSCMTLSRLYIRIKCTYFLEHLIEHMPALERLSVEFNKTLNIQPRSVSLIEQLCQSNGNWYNKVPNLRYFALKSFILNDLEFVYLKWLLNNLNHVQKLKLRLGNEKIYRADQIIWKSFIDANFVQQYCLPDIIDNIINFDFYTSSPCQLLPIDAEKVISSFQRHPLFITRQWTNIKYFYDPIRSYQHLFSTNINITLQSFNGLVNDPYVFQWPNIQHISIDFHPSLYIFLEQLDEKFPSVSSITVYMEYYKSFDEADVQLSLAKPFETGLHKVADIRFRNITKLTFGDRFFRENYACDKSTGRNKERAKVLAHLISMPVQLKYILLEKFQWLLHVVEYAFNELKNNALTSVRYTEFGIPSCHCGRNESAYIGKHLVPFLTMYMPDLQTLRLWRPDDFPWTTVLPNRSEGYFRETSHHRWWTVLYTSELIAQQVSIFEQDLRQLVEQLKHFVFLDIYGAIPYQKVEAYRSMVQTRFPNCRSHVDVSKFCLWL